MGKGYLYILECADGSFYVGSTDDVERRFRQHITGKGADYTRTHKPLRVIYTEEYATIGEAFKREKQLQKWSHAKKAALVAGDIELLRQLSTCDEHGRTNKKNHGKAKITVPELTEGHQAELG